MLTNSSNCAKLKLELQMGAISLKKKRKFVSISLKKKVNKPTPAIKYNEIGLPVLCGGGKTLRELYEEEKWGL